MPANCPQKQQLPSRGRREGNIIIPARRDCLVTGILVFSRVWSVLFGKESTNEKSMAINIRSMFDGWV
jgi:hypothetical protein